MLKEVGPNHAWRDYLPKNQEIFLILGQKLVSYLGNGENSNLAWESRLILPVELLGDMKEPISYFTKTTDL